MGGQTHGITRRSADGTLQSEWQCGEREGRSDADWKTGFSTRSVHHVIDAGCACRLPG